MNKSNEEVESDRWNKNGQNTLLFFDVEFYTGFPIKEIIREPIKKYLKTNKNGETILVGEISIID